MSESALRRTNKILSHLTGEKRGLEASPTGGCGCGNSSYSSCSRPHKASRVLITGAVGQIGYSMVPTVCESFLNEDIILVLLDIPPMLSKLKALEMEIRDCAYPRVKDIVVATDVKTAFEAVDFAFLVGAFPRKDGMERKDLLTKNCAIFKEQGKALNDYANRTVKVLVVGNPANTNCFIAQQCAPNIPKENFTAMTRLDHNRALGFVRGSFRSLNCGLTAGGQLASKAGVRPTEIRKVCIWGNHSATQYPDVTYGEFVGKGPITKVLPVEYLHGQFITDVQKRGAVIIQARGGLSSAMSAAWAAVEHMRDWVYGTRGQWVSMGIPSDGSYGIAPGVVYSFPVTCEDGKYKIVQGLDISEFSRRKMDATYAELKEEAAAATEILGLGK